MQIQQQENGVQVLGLSHFCLQETLFCGQCFRFEEIAQGRYEGVVGSHVVRVSQPQADALLVENTTLDAFNALWRNYFDLDTPYPQIAQTLARNPVLRKAIAFAPGIRVLQQDLWETLCTFILSQNNNIKRIRQLVRRLCEQFGQPIDESHFAFPTPQALCALSVEDLAPVRMGFRARYILDAAQKVASGQLNLQSLYALDCESAAQELMQITGVGRKVASCILLYGYHRIDICPMDTWMIKTMKALFPKGLPRYMLPYAGIAQQYLFHYVRNHPETVHLAG